MRKKTIKGNTLKVGNGLVTYTTYDGFKAVYGVSDYDGLGDHMVLEAILNLAPNNIVGHELVQRFDAWLRDQPEPKNIIHPYVYQNY